MRKLVINQITGFTTVLPFKIVDERKIEFYSSDFTNAISKGERLNFNLPKGVYFYDGSFTKLNKPVEHKPIELPPFERNFPKRKYKIMFGNNINKCTINHLTGVILFDNAFKIAPKYVLVDIYLHEMGHRYYKTEHLADLYATKRMLEKGFNKSQIGRSIVVSLRSENIERKILKINSLND